MMHAACQCLEHNNDVVHTHGTNPYNIYSIYRVGTYAYVAFLPSLPVFALLPLGINGII